MKNYVGDLLAAYFNCLDGNITYDGEPVKIYNVGVSADENNHHIQLRPESEFNNSNKSSFVISPVIIADIITYHAGAIDASIVEVIDDQLKTLLLPTRRTNGLAPISGVQITSIAFDNGTYLDGFDGKKHEYRKIIRFTNRLNQQ